MDVERAIRVAETVLPGRGVIVNESDSRWQALLSIRPCVAEDPGAVWKFARRWGSFHEVSLRNAVAVCVLQDLLAVHFNALLRQVVRLVRESRSFADTVSRCEKLGLCATPGNSQAFDDLQSFARRAGR